MRKLDTVECGRRRIDGFEPFRLLGQPLDKTIVVLDDVIEIFDLQNVDQPEPPIQNESEIDVSQPSKGGTTFVENSFVGRAIVANRSPEESSSATCASDFDLSFVSDPAGPCAARS